MPRSQQIHSKTLANGLTLLGEEMDFVSSAAYSILVPAGAANDPDGLEGSSGILTEMLSKGAGDWSARELSQQFEDLGAQRHSAAGIEASLFSGAVLGENLSKALELVATTLRKPRFPEEELEPVRELALQDLRSLEDEPSSKVMVGLAKQLYPHPFGRSQMGTTEGVQAIGIDSLKSYHAERYRPKNAIISVAGAFDWDEVCQTVERLFGDWEGVSERLAPGELGTKSSTHHLQQETNQLQIALAFPSVSLEHPDYSVARVAVGVLSGGMAGRLFIEVREKRGLVYRVSASHSAPAGRAAVLGYAGTTPENAEECLSVMVDEFRKMKDGVAADELQRSKADLKARVVMRGESTSARASALANDWWSLKRVRPLQEMADAIDAVTDEDIRRHMTEFPPDPITLVTLGPDGLELS